MKITPYLLESYQLGNCTHKEKMAVEQWLNSVEYEPTDVSRDVTIDMAESVWKSLSQKMGGGRPKPSLYKQLSQYAAVACMAFGFGYVFSFNSLPSAPLDAQREMTSHPDELVYLSSHPDSIKKIAADKFELEFDGVLRLYNNSLEIKELVCGGKKIMIPPGQVSYVMNTKTQGFRKLNIQSGELLFYEDKIKKAPIRICV